MNISFEERFGKEARPEACCEAPETQMVTHMALWMENSFEANGCRDTEDGSSLSVSLQISLESNRGPSCECHSHWKDKTWSNGTMSDVQLVLGNPRNFPSKEDRDPPSPKQNFLWRRMEQDVSSDSGKKGRNSSESFEKNLGEKEDPRINRNDHEIMAPMRDKAVRPKKARVSPLDLQLSIKEGRGLDR